MIDGYLELGFETVLLTRCSSACVRRIAVRGRPPGMRPGVPGRQGADDPRGLDSVSPSAAATNGVTRAPASGAVVGPAADERPRDDRESRQRALALDVDHDGSPVSDLQCYSRPTLSTACDQV
jgi:hypothetical protein